MTIRTFDGVLINYEHVSSIEILETNIGECIKAYLPNEEDFILKIYNM